MNKTPTPPMVEILMECHEREILKQEPLMSCMITWPIKGLLDRGYLKAVAAAKSPRILFKITMEGIEYLEKAESLLDKKATA